MAYDVRRTTRLERSELETADPERAREFVGSTYVRHLARLSGPPDRFLLVISSAVSPELSFHRARHSGELDVISEPLDRLAGFRLLQGGMSIEQDGVEARCRARQSGVFPLEHEFRLRSTDVELEVVSVGRAVVDVAAEVVGGVPQGALRIRGAVPVSPAMARHWHYLVGFMGREMLTTPSAFDSALLRAEAARAIAVAALMAFPNNALDRDYLRRVGDVAPAALRRAVGFIEAHAAEPINVADVAEAANVGVRALQAAFTRHYGVSPMAYLRSTRLELAHRDLVAADPRGGVTVAEVARRWGFTPSHFADAYRRHFGKQPHETLRE